MSRKDNPRLLHISAVSSFYSYRMLRHQQRSNQISNRCKLSLCTPLDRGENVSKIFTFSVLKTTEYHNLIVMFKSSNHM